MKRKITEKRGSAILISLLVMAVLVVISLGLNSLIVSELVVQRDEVERLKAFYAAESGIERGLLDVYEKNMPGFTRPYLIAKDISSAETNILDDKYFTAPEPLTKGDGSGYNYRYQVVGQDMELPCSYDPQKNDDYYLLEANQSATIPLHKYVEGADLEKEEVKDFLVEYYVEGAGLTPGAIAQILDKVDVLRWKILGINTSINQNYRRSLTGQFTDSISDYLPLNSLTNTSENPSQFATKVGLLSLAGGKSDIWTKANYYYKRTDVSDASADYYRNDRSKTISDFLDQNISTDKHEFNYLMLTNVLGENTKLEGGRFVRDDSNPAYDDLTGKQKLFYRIKADDTQEGNKQTLACEGFLVRSDGVFRNAKQSIDMKISLDTFLPVFDFVLYERKL